MYIWVLSLLKEAENYHFEKMNWRNFIVLLLLFLLLTGQRDCAVQKGKEYMYVSLVLSTCASE